MLGVMCKGAVQRDRHTGLDFNAVGLDSELVGGRAAVEDQMSGLDVVAGLEAWVSEGSGEEA